MRLWGRRPRSGEQQLSPICRRGRYEREIVLGDPGAGLRAVAVSELDHVLPQPGVRSGSAVTMNICVGSAITSAAPASRPCPRRQRARPVQPLLRPLHRGVFRPCTRTRSGRATRTTPRHRRLDPAASCAGGATSGTECPCGKSPSTRLRRRAFAQQYFHVMVNCDCCGPRGPAPALREAGDVPGPLPRVEPPPFPIVP